MTSSIPVRIRWAVDLLDVRPGDRILEIGCGGGVALSLIAARLRRGHVVGIDRSPIAVRRAAERNAVHIEAGRVRVQRAELESFRSREAFNRILAVNVNVFLTKPKLGAP
jgi:cyclopropane fatty-acyl-phospholipid synthase-like methyltransferase